MRTLRVAAIAAALSVFAAGAQASTVLTGALQNDGSEFGAIIISAFGPAFGFDFLGQTGHVDLGPGSYHIAFSATADIDDLQLAEAVNDDSIMQGAGDWWFFNEVNTAILNQFIPGGADEVYHAGDVISGTLVVPQNTSFANVYPTETITGSDTYSGVVAVAGFGAGEGTWTLSISAIPEPATWAFSILGFAALGAAMRRRRIVGA